MFGSCGVQLALLGCDWGWLLSDLCDKDWLRELLEKIWLCESCDTDWLCDKWVGDWLDDRESPPPNDVECETVVVLHPQSALTTSVSDSWKARSEVCPGLHDSAMLKSDVGTVHAVLPMHLSATIAVALSSLHVAFAAKVGHAGPPSGSPK